MDRFVSFKTPRKDGESGAGPPIAVNPRHVVLIEPIATQAQPKCRLWLALAFDADGENRDYRDVLGTLREVGLRLQSPDAKGDPLGTFH